MAIIEARGLARTFISRKRIVEAVRGVDLAVEPGEIVGLLGPNGAGKTTTLRMLTTLLRPTGGTAVIAGADLLRDPAGVRRRIGFVPQASGQTLGGTNRKSLVVEELLDQAAAFRIPAAETSRRVADLIDQLDLTGLDQRYVGSLSGGQRRRLEIAIGLIHQPAVVFLDEPTTGLDPQSRASLWDHIRRMRAEMGATIFLTTHYLEEADSLCDRLFIVDHGRTVTVGTPSSLKQQVAGDVVTLEVTAGPVPVHALLAGRPNVREVAVEGGTVQLTVADGETTLPALLEVLGIAGVTVHRISLARPTLDDVFLALTGRSLRDGTTAGIAASAYVDRQEGRADVVRQ